MSDEVKKGLLGIVVDETEVSKVMPEINSLTYRGYAVQDLCEFCRFEEAAYLILKGDLPNTIELRQFEKIEKGQRDLSKNLYEIISIMILDRKVIHLKKKAMNELSLKNTWEKNNKLILKTVYEN